MARGISDLIEDMLIAIDDIKTFTGEMEMAAFLSSPRTDRRTYLAVIAAFTQLAEAARALPDEFRDRNPHVEWKLISGMRNLLVHEYFRADAEVIWLTAKSAKLDILQSALKRARDQ
jgi:uncharacterized protein with HEPN domain